MKALRLIFLFLFLGFACNTSAQKVYVTKTGEKYHTNSCRYLKYSKYEITLEKAIKQGYDACLVCKPSKENSETTTSSNSITPKTQSKKSTATQCTGKTKAGNRCKRKTTNSNGRCYQH